MDYHPLRIVDAVKDINRGIFLPDIQREFEWGVDRIEKLFDSIMQDYPIGTFLFWKVEEHDKNIWDIYEFIREFDKEDPHNKDANLAGTNHPVLLVLDGQQRLASLYVGLKGSYRYFYYSWKKTRLYLNLLKSEEINEDNPEEPVYQFSFIEDGKVNNSATEFWYCVGNILDFEDAEDAKNNIAPKLTGLSDKLKDNAMRIIGRLHTRIHTKATLNYYEERSQSPDKILQIFVRANSGGMPLEYSDLLLSTATAKWQTLNARKEVNSFTDSINQIGSGFNFGKDFVLKGCFFLTGELPVQYKIANFTNDNLQRIEANWDNTIKPSIETAVKIVSKYGFMSKNLVAPISVLPLSLFISKINKKNYEKSSEKTDVEVQTAMQKWLILVLLKNAFGSSTDTKLMNARKVIASTSRGDYFPLSEINKTLGISDTFTDEEIENLMGFNYKGKYTYLALSLLYPNRDWKGMVFHEDHIYPKSEFTIAKLKKRGYSDDQAKEYLAYFNTVLNLQLITDTENLEKNAKPFEEWIKTRDDAFKARHHIPECEHYDFDHFMDFINKRREMLKACFQAL